MVNSQDNEKKFDVPSVFMQAHATGKKHEGQIDEIVPDVAYKKIVVYIRGEENIKYTNKLSVDERNDIINEIMEVSRTKSFYQMKQEVIKGYIKQLMIIMMTIAIFVPLLLFVINKSYQYTMNSYQTSENNFRKLYQKKNLKILNGDTKKQKYVKYGSDFE